MIDEVVFTFFTLYFSPPRTKVIFTLFSKVDLFCGFCDKVMTNSGFVPCKEFSTGKTMDAPEKSKDLFEKSSTPPVQANP